MRNQNKIIKDQQKDKQKYSYTPINFQSHKSPSPISPFKKSIIQQSPQKLQQINIQDQSYNKNEKIKTTPNEGQIISHKSKLLSTQGSYNASKIYQNYHSKLSIKTQKKPLLTSNSIEKNQKIAQKSLQIQIKQEQHINLNSSKSKPVRGSNSRQSDQNKNSIVSSFFKREKSNISNNCSKSRIQKKEKLIPKRQMLEYRNKQSSISTIIEQILKQHPSTKAKQKAVQYLQQYINELKNNHISSQQLLTLCENPKIKNLEDQNQRKALQLKKIQDQNKKLIQKLSLCYLKHRQIMNQLKFKIQKFLTKKVCSFSEFQKQASDIFNNQQIKAIANIKIRNRKQSPKVIHKETEIILNSKNKNQHNQQQIKQKIAFHSKPSPKIKSIFEKESQSTLQMLKKEKIKNQIESLSYNQAVQTQLCSNIIQNENVNPSVSSFDYFLSQVGKIDEIDQFKRSENNQIRILNFLNECHEEISKQRSQSFKKMAFADVAIKRQTKKSFENIKKRINNIKQFLYSQIAKYKELKKVNFKLKIQFDKFQKFLTDELLRIISEDNRYHIDKLNQLRNNFSNIYDEFSDVLLIQFYDDKKVIEQSQKVFQQQILYEEQKDGDKQIKKYQKLIQKVETKIVEYFKWFYKNRRDQISEKISSQSISFENQFKNKMKIFQKEIIEHFKQIQKYQEIRQKINKKKIKRQLHQL